MKDSYFGFGSPQQQVNSMQGQKTHTYSYNILAYFLNDSQMIHSTINFSKPSFCVTLMCADWSISALPRKTLF